MRAWIALLMMVPACWGGSDNPGDDAKMDAPLTCLGSFAKVCFTKAPTTPVMVTEDINDINTDAIGIPPLVCDQNNEQKGTYCVIAGMGFTIPVGKSIRAHGNKPLVLLSTTSFDLQGTVDVSSNHNSGSTNIGAGAALACTGMAAATGNSGGYGGSFGGKGGDGEQLIGAGEAKGIAAAPIAFPKSLSGGCPGGNGSTTVVGATAGVGGPGGGAVAIVAMDMIHLDGKINASGAGGHGGLLNKGGAGGGGSGGMIVLEASSIPVGATAALFANGGGGGQGGAGGTGAGAGAGADGGESPGPMTAALGGNSTSKDGGVGGNGSFGAGRLTGANGGSSPALNMGGGGAGGGGAGFIHAPGVTGANISPPSTNP